MAVGIALSPIPIAAVVLMLMTARARSNGLAFVAGWLLGLAAVGAVVLGIGGGAGASSSGAPATWVSWVLIVLGALLLALAVREFRSRPTAGQEAPMPKWMARIDEFKAPVALGLGALLVGLNPKNLILAVGGASTIAETGISGGEQVLAYLVFVVVATVSVAAPVAIYLTMGDRAAGTLGRLKDWMIQNNAVIIAVILLLIGVKLIGDAISALT
jgi:hypothetical protein